MQTPFYTMLELAGAIHGVEVAAMDPQIGRQGDLFQRYSSSTLFHR